MKILYLSNGNLPDYGADACATGLKKLFGDDVVDYRRIWFLYADSFGPGKANLKDLYGMGFGYYGTLGSDANCDRTDIVNKIKSRYFDIIWYASIQRNQAYFGGVTSVYPKNKIVMVDTEDYPGTLVLQDKGIFLKREFCGTGDGIYPIEFGYPAEKILSEPPTKTRFMATYDPLVNRQYAYDNEADYLRGYAESYFAPTMRKSGWCCLRHYEILSQWAIPYFRMADAIPATIMTRYPKTECDIVRRLIEYGPTGCETAIDFYERNIETIMKNFREKLTTESIAKYVLDIVAANK